MNKKTILAIYILSILVVIASLYAVASAPIAESPSPQQQNALSEAAVKTPVGLESSFKFLHEKGYSFVKAIRFKDQYIAVFQQIDVDPCHGCPVLLGALAANYDIQQNRWRAKSISLEFGKAGEQGEIYEKDVQFQIITPDVMGFWVESRFTSQGEQIVDKTLYSMEKDQVKKILEIPILYDTFNAVDYSAFSLNVTHTPHWNIQTESVDLVLNLKITGAFSKKNYIWPFFSEIFGNQKRVVYIYQNGTYIKG